MTNTFIVTADTDSTFFQDCMNVVNSFEKGCHNSATEAATIAPLAHMVQTTKAWAKTNSKVLSSWTPPTSVIGTSTTGTLQTTSQLNTVAAIAEGCIPCLSRLQLAAELAPSSDTLDMFAKDLEQKLAMMTQLDGLLSNTNVFSDLCQLLSILNQMCTQDLQRIISILMASLLQVNVNLSGLAGFITALVMPLFAPVLSGLVTLLEQYTQLVIGPADCILLLLQSEINQINAITQSQVATNLGPSPSGALDPQSISTGLQVLYTNLNAGVAQINSKFQFYIQQIEQAFGDFNGNSSSYMNSAQAKLQTIQMINIITSLIQLEKKGGSICAAGNPSTAELNNFFTNYLNPNSYLQFTTGPNGAVLITSPGNSLYQPSSNDTIDYAPPGLLTTQVSTVIPCSINTNQADVAQINQWIAEINSVGGNS